MRLLICRLLFIFCSWLLLALRLVCMVWWCLMVESLAPHAGMHAVMCRGYVYLFALFHFYAIVVFYTSCNFSLGLDADFFLSSCAYSSCFLSGFVCWL